MQELLLGRVHVLELVSCSLIFSHYTNLSREEPFIKVFKWVCVLHVIASICLVVWLHFFDWVRARFLVKACSSVDIIRMTSVHEHLFVTARLFVASQSWGLQVWSFGGIQAVLHPLKLVFHVLYFWWAPVLTFDVLHLLLLKMLLQRLQLQDHLIDDVHFVFYLNFSLSQLLQYVIL